MSNLFLTLLIFYFIIFSGFVFGRIFKRYNREIRKILSFTLLFILTPPIIFFAFFLSQISLNLTIILNIIIFQVVLIFFTQFITYLIYLRNGDDTSKKRKGAILNLVAFPNAMLFPLPIVLSLFGMDYVIIIVIFSLAALILRNTWSIYLNMYYGGSEKQSFKDTLKKMLTFPPTLTLIICFILKSFNLTFDQQILNGISNIFSYTTTILGGVLIGVLVVNINLNHVKSFKKDFAVVLIIRTLFSFILFLFLTIFLTFPTEIKSYTLTILLLVYVNPPAVNNTIYAEYFELDKDFTAFCVIMITILAIFYVPLTLFIGFLLF